LKVGLSVVETAASTAGLLVRETVDWRAVEKAASTGGCLVASMVDLRAG